MDKPAELWWEVPLQGAEALSEVDPVIPAAPVEVQNALVALRDGDPWPTAILHYKAGRPERLGQLLRHWSKPLPGGARAFVADLVTGGYARTKRDRGLYVRANVVALVALGRWIMEDHRRAPPTFELLKAKNVDELYAGVAEVVRKWGLANISADGVAHIIKKERRAHKKRGPMTP